MTAVAVVQGLSQFILQAKDLQRQQPAIGVERLAAPQTIVLVFLLDLDRIPDKGQFPFGLGSPLGRRPAPLLAAGDPLLQG